MAIAFTYTEATNIVVVTGGTSDTPATFADFVTADRAGTATLLVATAGLSPTLALTYQIRPVEDMALLITFTVAAKTAQADYIFITGTDWRDAAQTEAIDVTAGNGAYVSTKYFRTITNIDCSDNAAGGGTVWANGTVAVTQPQWGVIWDYGNGQYKVDSHFVVGNTSDSTYFSSVLEMVSFGSPLKPSVVALATLSLGKLQGDYGKQGSSWRFNGPLASGATFNNGGTVLIYASKLDITTNSRLTFASGTTTIKNSLLLGNYGDYPTGEYFRNFAFNGGTISLDKVFLSDVHSLLLSVSPSSLVDVHLHYGFSGLYTLTGALVTATGFLSSNTRSRDVYIGTAAGTANLVDPVVEPSVLRLDNANNVARAQYTINIHITDRDGTAIQTAAVLCEDDADADIFDVTTDASGDITEQTITAKSWTGTSETLDDNNPFKFTISKAGYETLVLENITVDAPIVWHLELQPIRHPVGIWIDER